MTVRDKIKTYKKIKSNSLKKISVVVYIATKQIDEKYFNVLERTYNVTYQAKPFESFHAIVSTSDMIRHMMETCGREYIDRLFRRPNIKRIAGGSRQIHLTVQREYNTLYDIARWCKHGRH